MSSALLEANSKLHQPSLHLFTRMRAFFSSTDKFPASLPTTCPACDYENGILRINSSTIATLFRITRMKAGYTRLSSPLHCRYLGYADVAFSSRPVRSLQIPQYLFFASATP